MAPRTCITILFLLNLPFLLYLFKSVIFVIYLVSCGIILEHFRLSTNSTLTISNLIPLCFKSRGIIIIIIIIIISLAHPTLIQVL
jgi:hypothetical protein